MYVYNKKINNSFLNLKRYSSDHSIQRIPYTSTKPTASVFHPPEFKASTTIFRLSFLPATINSDKVTNDNNQSAR